MLVGQFLPSMSSPYPRVCLVSGGPSLFLVPTRSAALPQIYTTGLLGCLCSVFTHVSGDAESRVCSAVHIQTQVLATVLLQSLEGPGTLKTSCSVPDFAIAPPFAGVQGTDH